MAVSTRSARFPSTTPRRPLVPIAIAFAFGVYVDSLVAISPAVSLTLAAASLAVAPWRTRLSRHALGIAIIATGGVWHHVQVRQIRSDDASRWVGEERTLCRIQGQVLGEIIVSSPREEEAKLMSIVEPRSRLTVQVTRLENAAGWRNATGRVALSVGGKLSDVQAGESIQVIGWLSKPRGPTNPGEFDYRDYLAARGIHSIMFTETPDSVQRLTSTSWFSLTNLRDRSRDALSKLLRRHLEPATAHIGEAFLLGIRSAVPQEELLPFIESGTVHILVVSGLHVGMVAAMIWTLGLLLGLSLSRRALLTIAAVAAYAFFTGGTPPAVRAAVLTGLWLGGYLIHRGADPINSLAGSLLVVLIIQPSDLLQAGAQMSFLCAFALIAIVPKARVYISYDPGDSSVLRWRRWVYQATLDLLVASVVLWIITAPLVMNRFHLFSPIAVVASIPLVATSGLVLALGMLFFLFGWIPFVGTLFAFPLGWFLQMMTWTSRLAASVEPLCRYVAGPPTWWVAGLYALLIGPWLWPRIRPAGRAHVILIGLWATIGLLIAILAPPRVRSQYDQLDVGHGLAGVFQSTSGRTAIFDCGAIRGPRVGERIIAPFLWHNGIRKIDLLVISHSDIDHFNGILQILRRFPVGVVLVSPQFASSSDPAVRFVLSELRRLAVPVRIVSEGTTLNLDGTELTVCHPPQVWEGNNDNAASLVVELQQGARSILFTGDLSDNGLERLLATPKTSTNVLIAPHHGARSSNTDAMAQWANPDVVISSQSAGSGPRDPLDVYSPLGAKLFRTDRDGSIRVQWDREQVWIEPFLSDSADSSRSR